MRSWAIYSTSTGRYGSWITRDDII